MNVAAPDRPLSVPAGGLAEFVARLFVAAGVPEAAAASVAGGLVEADLEGLASHGVMLADMYIERLRQGSVSRETKAAVISERQGAVVLDAGKRAWPADGDAGDGHRDRQGAPVCGRHRFGSPRLSFRRGGPLRASRRECRLRRHRHVQYAASDAGARAGPNASSATIRSPSRCRRKVKSRSCSTWRPAKPPWARSAWRRKPRQPFRRPGPSRRRGCRPRMRPRPSPACCCRPAGPRASACHF